MTTSLSNTAIVALIGATVGLMLHRGWQHHSRGHSSDVTVSSTIEPRTFHGSPALRPSQRDALATVLQRLRPHGEREERIIASINDPEEARELRHSRQLEDLRKRDIRLSPDERDAYLRISDAAVRGDRLARAQFLSGELTEQDYLDTRIDTLRTAFAAYRDTLDGPSFQRIFLRRPDVDPFDPSGAIVSPSAQNNSRDTSFSKETLPTNEATADFAKPGA